MITRRDALASLAMEISSFLLFGTASYNNIECVDNEHEKKMGDASIEDSVRACAK